MKFQKHITAFEESLRSTGASSRTVETYCGNTRLFLAFVEANYPRVRSIQRVSREVVQDYQVHLSGVKTEAGRPLAASTQIVKLRAIRAFFRFLCEQGLILVDPSARIRLPKERYQIDRNILSQDDVRLLLENLPTRDPLSIRNRAIVELFYACGLRTSELCDLKLGDVDLKEQTVTIVRGKGGRSRVLPIGQYAAHYIGLYGDRARKYMLRGRHTDPGNLFLSQRGNPFDRSTINKTVMRTVSKALPLDARISCYGFRHATASHLLQNGVDVTYIARLLGHRSLRTTQRYLNVGIEDLKRVHSLCHPREMGT